MRGEVHDAWIQYIRAEAHQKFSRNRPIRRPDTTFPHLVFHVPMVMALCLLLPALLAARSADAVPRGGRLIRVVEGDDWLLPADVQPTPGCGLGWVDAKWVRRWTKLYPIEDPQGTLGVVLVF